MEHHRPHASPTFEGYYNKFLLPSGASLILIISNVPKGTEQAHMVCFTYVPHDGSDIFQQELYPEDLTFEDNPNGGSFELRAPEGLVSMEGGGNFSFVHEDVVFRATVKKRTAWSTRTSTPEGILVYLPLPLHWHVQSLASVCDFMLELPPSVRLPRDDMKGQAMVHEEKNWANGFPTAHMWVQARAGGRGVCLAGGKILGMQAFLAGYRNDQQQLEIDFRPPFALKFLGVGPFMSFHSDWENRTFSLSVQDLAHKMVLKASAPKGSFFGLSAPLPGGHQSNAMAQSMNATVEVEVWRRNGWFGGWLILCKDKFEGAALEFGGDYYPLAGSEKKRN